MEREQVIAQNDQKREREKNWSHNFISPALVSFVPGPTHRTGHTMKAGAWSDKDGHGKRGASRARVLPLVVHQNQNRSPE